MKLFSMLSALMLIEFTVIGQVSNKKTFEISGTIRGLNGAPVYLLYSLGDENRPTDTLIAKSEGDHFKLASQIEKSLKAYLFIGNPRLRKQVFFFLEPGKIRMEGDVDSLEYLAITGTPSNNDLTATQRFLSPLYGRRAALSQKLRGLGAETVEAKKLMQEINSKTDSVNAYRLRFMETHPKSEVSFSYLYVLQDGLPTPTVERIYNSFPTEWKNSREGKNIYTKLQASKSVAVGNKAPHFTSTDPNGKKISLSDFKGQYVLLEFWAHWCVPCREQHPHLKEVYQKFKDKGFTILQYSVDVKKDEQKWKDAIKKDGLVWSQSCDLTEGKAPVATLYGVQPIPDNFLISPNGTILGRRLSPKQLEEQLINLLK